ncbi:TPA_asm: adenosine deaminase, partial [Listeria monocytogenes]|nr:adenosine deaminase [Listeria monocytogenes]
MRKNGNKLLKQAKKNKNDEFYTQLIDIESELKYYQNKFKQKIIYCNTDD